MNSGLITTLLLAVLGWGFWETSRTNASVLWSLYGIVSGPSAKEAAYFSGMETALDAHLTSQGFRSAPSPTPWGGMHAGTELSKAYAISGRTLRPVQILVTRRSGSSDGLSVSLFWDFVGFRWNRDGDEARAGEVGAEVRQWIVEYLRSHPRP